MHNEVAAKAECGIETFSFILRVYVLVLKILVSKNLSRSVKQISLLGGPERFGLERFGFEKNVSISVSTMFLGPVLSEQNMSFRFGC